MYQHNTHHHSDNRHTCNTVYLLFPVDQHTFISDFSKWCPGVVSDFADLKLLGKYGRTHVITLTIYNHKAMIMKMHRSAEPLQHIEILSGYG